MKYIISVDIIVEDVRESKAVNSVEGILKFNPYIKHFEILDVEEMDPLDEGDNE